MSQHDLEISNQTFPATRTDLNNALQALGSLQSGASEPSTKYANSLWYDTTNNVLKLRNEANDAWIEICDVDQANDLIELSSKLKAPNGSQSTPSMTFDSDGDTGIYRKTTNTLAITAGGTEVASFSSSAITLGSSIKLVAQSMYPVGSVYINASDSTNPATLFGFGTWVSFGAGRVPVGIDTGDTSFDSVGETGGSKDAVVVSHSHTITDPGHTHNLSLDAYSGGGGGPAALDVNQYYNQTVTKTTASATTGISVNSAGSSGTNANLQPYIVVYMWKRTA